MNKEDLKNGMVVELQNNRKFMVLDDKLITYNGYEELCKYNDKLKHKTICLLDVVKIYTIEKVLGLNYIFDVSDLRLIWQRPTINLTEDEKAILRNLPKEYKYIARDETDHLYIYYEKPLKGDHSWYTGNHKCWSISPFKHLFQFIKWEDEEPYLISDLLGE